MSRRKQLVVVGIACLAVFSLSRPAATDERPTPYPSYPTPPVASPYPDPTVGIPANGQIPVEQYVQMARHYAHLQSSAGSLNKAALQLQREIWAIEMLERAQRIAETTAEGKEDRLRGALKRLEPAVIEVVVAHKLQQAEHLLREVAEGVPDSESGKTAKKMLEALGKSQ